MKFSKTTEYAFQIFNYMILDEDKLYTADNIYNQLKIPFRYLRKLLTHLTKNGLLLSVQGQSGGYKLAKKQNEINLIDIINASDKEGLKNTCFFGFSKCSFETKCAMHDKWNSIQENTLSVLQTTTLFDLKKNNS